MTLMSENILNINLINLCVLLLSVGLIAYVFFSRKEHIYRPAFILSVLSLIFYQIPMVLFSQQLTVGLSDFGYFAFVVEITVIFGVLWVLMTPNLSPPIGVINTLRGPGTKYELKPVTWMMLWGACAGLLVVYLSNVPFSCTGLYTLIVDPEMVSWAREFSMKLSGSKLASYAYGTLANTVIPVLTALTFYRIKKVLFEFKFTQFFMLLALILVLIFILFLPGIKGMLMPTLLVIITVVVLTSENFVVKLL